jgi:hypothetical protein
MPFAVPLPLVTEIHDALLTVVQVHPLVVVTVVVNGPPAGLAGCAVDESV